MANRYTQYTKILHKILHNRKLAASNPMQETNEQLGTMNDFYDNTSDS